MALGQFPTDIKHIIFLLASVVCMCFLTALFVCLVYMCSWFAPTYIYAKAVCFLRAGKKNSQSLRCFSFIYSVFPLTKPITAPSLSSYCLTFIRERKWERIRDGERHCMFLEEKLAVFILISLYSIIFQNAIRGANYLSSLYNGCGSDGL